MYVDMCNDNDNKDEVDNVFFDLLTPRTSNPDKLVNNTRIEEWTNVSVTDNNEYLDVNDSIGEQGVNRSYKSNSIMAWNCQGLQKKLKDSSFVRYCSNFNIFSLSEIWCCNKEEIENTFPEYKIFYAPRVNRIRGGVAVGVRGDIINKISEVKVLSDAVFLKLESSILGTPADVIASFIYVAPERSPIYEDENVDGIELLETNMYDIAAKYPGLPWLLAGDFNARTFNLEILNDDRNVHAEPINIIDEVFINVNIPERKSKDKASNVYGEKLIDLCNDWNLFILNGRKSGDSKGEITCIANKGKSIVDYMICSGDIYEYVKNMYVDNRCESDHFPIVMNFDAVDDDTMSAKEEIDLEDILIYKWNEEHTAGYRQSLSHLINEHFTQFQDILTKDINEGTNFVISTIQKAASNMKKCNKLKQHRKPQPMWWDTECNLAKEDKYNELKNFRKTNTQESLNKFLDKKKDFRELCTKKKVQHNNTVLEELNESCKDSNSKQFWQKVKSLISKANYGNTAKTIDASAWYNYFKNLLNVGESQVDQSDVNEIALEMEDHVKEHNRENNCMKCNAGLLDEDISESEIKNAIDALKKGKAAGPDGMSSDFFITGSDVLLKMLHPLFNKIFQCGVYPENWSKSIIFPLYKKGNPKNVDNYRGISLLNVISKLYCHIINKRLYNFCEINNCIPEAQAGFRKGYSTIDNIFNLQSLVQKYLTKKGGRFYTLFVDFSKAYDCVDRKKLMYLLLEKVGIHGKMFMALNAMYSEVKSAVRIGTKITEYFECMSGVKQGCILSPLLFSLFLAELNAELEGSTAQGIDIFADPIGVLLLMYADDLALVADNVKDLQRKINCLEMYCEKWGLTVNMSKTKVVVFKNGGFNRQTEKWTYKGDQIQVVADYCYLGVIFGSTLNWAKCVKNLSSKAKKAMAGIKRLHRTLGSIPVSTLFHIFDTKIKPILLYGSEVWGFKKYEDIEKVQVNFCKTILGVGRDVKNKIALGECGRFPIYIDSYMRLIKYWYKILAINDNRLPKQCYKMLYEQDLSGRKNWATSIKNILYTSGFGVVWENQGVGNTDIFLKEFRQRLEDIYRQDWCSSLENDTEYMTYHSTIERARYVSVLNDRTLRRTFCLIRCNRLKLKATSCFSETTTNVNCEICNLEEVEDMCHFLLVCPSLAHIRRKYIPLYYHRFPTSFKVDLLLTKTSNSDKLCINVSCFVEKAYRERLKRLENNKTY